MGAEYHIRAALVPYLKYILNQMWHSLRYNLSADSINEYMHRFEKRIKLKSKFDEENLQRFLGKQNLNDTDLDEFIKVLLSSLSVTDISRSNINHLNIDSELEMQSIFYIFKLSSYRIRQDLCHDIFFFLNRLLTDTINLRNAISHDRLIQDRQFEMLLKKFTSSVTDFKKAVSDDPRHLFVRESIRNLANSLDVDQFQG